MMMLLGSFLRSIWATGAAANVLTSKSGTRAMAQMIMKLKKPMTGFRIEEIYR